jgi:hypothetical protein
MTLLRTLQETEGLRPDVQTIVADDETARLQAVRSALAAGRTVYVTRPLPGLAGDQSLGAVVGTTDVGDQFPALIRVAPPYYEPPLPAHPFDSRLAQGMRLAGYDVQEHAAHWQAWARLRLWWRTPNGVRDRLKVSARLLNADGQLVAAVDAEPVANAYPTTSWLPGEVIADAYEIPLPIGLPPGDYVPLVVVYDPETGAEQGRVTLPAVRLAANLERAPRQALEATLARLIPTLFGEVELLGWTPPDPAVAYRPGDHLPLTLLWQARRQPAGAWQVEFALEGDDHRVPLGSAPLGGGFEAGQWTAGQAVRQWPGLVVPDDVPPGAYHLSLRILHDGRPVPWGRWLLPLGSDFDLGRVQVTD